MRSNNVVAHRVGEAWFDICSKIQVLYLVGYSSWVLCSEQLFSLCIGIKDFLVFKLHTVRINWDKKGTCTVTLLERLFVITAFLKIVFELFLCGCECNQFVTLL